VGNYFLNGVHTLAEAWNGSTWTMQAAPNPSGSQNAVLREVSCTSAAACTAVGESSGRTLAERWNGANWTIQSTPNPAGLPALSGVSCTSSTSCTAVGKY
jgi:hypothetical protein